MIVVVIVIATSAMEFLDSETTVTQAFLLMQMERIQALETQMGALEATLSNLVHTQRQIVNILVQSSQGTMRLLHTTEQGIVTIGRTHISDLVQDATALSQSIESLQLS
jgi:hypothetical protein